jgi:hypothetical protein
MKFLTKRGTLRTSLLSALTTLFLCLSLSGYSQIPGDVNNSCCVDDADLLIVLFQFGQTGSGLQGDADGNGVVDDADLLIVLFNFGLCGPRIENNPEYLEQGNSVTLQGTGCSSGGTITWTVTQPGNQVTPASGSGSSFRITAQTGSSSRNDVIIRMTHTDSQGTQRQTQVRMTVVEIDLDIFKPKVIDPNEGEIEEWDELTAGAQTWVNLDNDDRDDKFDTGTTDTNVAGENEMCKIRLRLKPKDLNAGKVKLESISGGGTIKVWSAANKGTEVALPKELNVPGDMAVQGDYLEKTYWVEGITAHTSQQQAKMKMTYDKAPNRDDRVALTVLGIKKLAWIGKGNGFTAGSNDHNSNTLDADPNFPTGGANPGSNRVIPDARRPNFDTALDKVELEVELTVEPVYNVNVYVRSFDCDDPSSDTDFIDPNDLGGAGGNYSGTTVSYNVQEDNRGAVDTLKAGKFTGQDANAIATLAFTPNDIKKKIDFQVALHPGDNYRAVAYGDPAFLRNLRNRDRDDGFRIVDAQIAGDAAAREVREAAKYCSNVLTVWRQLHVENDSMVAVPAAGAQRNSVSGNITAVTGNATTAQRVTLSVNLRTGLPSGADTSPNLSSAPAQNGRFEGGSITIGTGGGATATGGLLGNGNTFVQRNGGITIPFTVTKAGQANVTGNVIALAGTTFTLRITAGALVAGHNGGTITVAGVGMAITGVNVGASTVTVGALANIPFVLVDDDAFALPSNPNLNGLDTAFNPAYLLVVRDGGGGNNNDQTVPFLLNGPNSSAGEVGIYDGNRGSKNNEKDQFWVVYLCSAYQDVQWDGNSGDSDSASEGAYTGSTSPFGTVHNINLSTGGNGALIWREAERDVGWNAALQRRNVAHEAGHQFGLGHGDAASPGGAIAEWPNIGLMHPFPADANSGDTFIPRHINLIRSRVRSPGH